MGEVEGLAERLGGIRDLLQKARPILAARRAELGPLLTALGQCVFEDPRPPLTERVVSEFEGAHGPLPIEYRAFVTEVGNGGPGPGFGMPELSPPFPQTDFTPGRPLPPDLVNRLVPIAGLGCGMAWHLVVGGPDTGNVWYYDEDGFVPCDPRRGFMDWYAGWLAETLRLGRVAPGPIPDAEPGAAADGGA